MPKTTKTPMTLIRFIQNRHERAADDLYDAKQEFNKLFVTDPVGAIEWGAKRIIAAKIRFDFWDYLYQSGNRQAAEPKLFSNATLVRSAEETIEAGLAGFFGSNSTCPWRNAARRVEAETYQELKRYLAEMTELATNPNA
jgi:hypothetical protein